MFRVSIGTVSCTREKEGENGRRIGREKRKKERYPGNGRGKVVACLQGLRLPYLAQYIVTYLRYI